MGEVWQAVPEYEGLYEASTLGRIRSVDRLITGKNGVTKRFSGRVLKPVKQNAGYFALGLSKAGIVETVLVHRIVAKTFLGNPEGLEEVNHIDGVKGNNALSNLEWMSRVRNIRHAMGMGLIQGLGENNPAAKINDESAMQIKELLRLGLHPNEIAPMFGVKPSTAFDILLGRSWMHVRLTGQWSEIRKERDGSVRRVTIELLS